MKVDSDRLGINTYTPSLAKDSMLSTIDSLFVNVRSYQQWWPNSHCHSKCAGANTNLQTLRTCYVV